MGFKILVFSGASLKDKAECDRAQSSVVDGKTLPATALTGRLNKNGFPPMGDRLAAANRDTRYFRFGSLCKAVHGDPYA